MQENSDLKNSLKALCTIYELLCNGMYDGSSAYNVVCAKKYIETLMELTEKAIKETESGKPEEAKS